MFYACSYDGNLGGYPVRYLKGFLIAVFIQESEAHDYAEYREEALFKYNTTDTAVIKHDKVKP